MTTYYSVVSVYRKNHKPYAYIGDMTRSERAPDDTQRAEGRRTIYVDWFGSLEAAEAFRDDVMGVSVIEKNSVH